MPDIEFRFYEWSKKQQEKKDYEDEDLLNDNVEHTRIEESHIEEDDDYDDCNIFERLSRIVERNGCICYPAEYQNVRK